jgi:hypothetical protein
VLFRALSLFSQLFCLETISNKLQMSSTTLQQHRVVSPIRSASLAANAAAGGHTESSLPVLAGDRAKIINDPLIDKSEKQKDSRFTRFIAKLTGKSSSKPSQQSTIRKLLASLFS